MVEALIGMLRNSDVVSSNDVKTYLEKHEGLIYKMNNIVYANLNIEVQKKHFETL